MTFDREKAADLAEALSAELEKLRDEEPWVQEAGGVLTVARYCLESLPRNLRSGLYAGLEPGPLQ